MTKVTNMKVPSKAEWEKRRKEYLAAIKANRLWPEGSVSACPTCHKRALVGRSDLVHQEVRPGNVQTFRNLRGAKCEACGSQFLDPEEIIAIEDTIGVGVVADFEAKVSRIGTGTLGTYWPKDVVRNLGLEPDTRAFIQVLDRETALVKFVHEQ